MTQPKKRRNDPANPEAGADLVERFTAEYSDVPVEVIAEQVKRAQTAMQLFGEDAVVHDTLGKAIRNNLDSMGSALDTGAQVASEQLAGNGNDDTGSIV